MRLQQTHLSTLNSIRAKENKGNIYASMYDVLNDLERNDHKIVERLDTLLKAGEIKSIEEMADFFYECFTEARIECETLVKTL